MEEIKRNLFIIPLVIGLICVIVSLATPVPGAVLTTYASLNGQTASGFELDNKYSTIDEYIKGDAYNYIIGSTLVGAKISGAMTAKAIYMVAGLLCIGLAIALFMLYNLNSKKLKELVPPADEVKLKLESAHKKIDEAKSEIESKIDETQQRFNDTKTAKDEAAAEVEERIAKNLDL